MTLPSSVIISPDQLMFRPIVLCSRRIIPASDPWDKNWSKIPYPRAAQVDIVPGVARGGMVTARIEPCINQQRISICLQKSAFNVARQQAAFQNRTFQHARTSIFLHILHDSCYNT